MGEVRREKIKVMIKPVVKSEMGQRLGKEWHRAIEILSKNEVLESVWKRKTGLIEVFSTFKINKRRR